MSSIDRRNVSHGHVEVYTFGRTSPLAHEGHHVTQLTLAVCLPSKYAQISMHSKQRVTNLNVRSRLGMCVCTYTCMYERTYVHIAALYFVVFGALISHTRCTNVQYVVTTCVCHWRELKRLQ